MKDQARANQELIEENVLLKQRILELEKSEAGSKRAEEALQESEARYRQLFEHAPAGIYEVDLTNGRFLSVNDLMCEYTGYTRDEFLGLRPLDLLTEDSQQRLLQRLAHIAAREPVPPTVEYQIRGKNGREFWVLLNSQYFYQADAPVRATVVIHDITERKRAEEALRKSEESALGLAHENAVMAEIGRIIGSTPNLDAVYQLFAEKVKGLLPYDRIVINLIHKDSGALVNRYVEGDSAPGRNLGEVFPMAGTSTARLFQSRKGLLLDSQDENEITVNFPGLVPELKAGFRSFLSVPLISGDQPIGGLHFRSKRYRAYEEKDLKLAGTIAAQITGAIANAQLFSERKEAENALQDSEERFRLLAENARDTIWTMDMNLQYIYMSPYIKQVLDYTPEEYVAIPLSETMTPASLKLCMQVLAEELEIEKREAKDLLRSRTVEVEHIHRNGDIVWAEIKMTFMRNAAGQAMGILGYTRNITDRKQAEDALRQSEEKYRLIAENTADVISIHDMNLRFTYISPSILRIRGFTVEEAMEETLDQIMTPESLKIALAAFEEEMKLEASGTADPDRIRTIELEEYRKDGSIIQMEASLSFLRDKDHKPVAILATTRDITKRKRAEEAVQESEQRYRFLAENANDVIWTLDMDLKIAYISPSVEQSRGFTVEEAKAQTLPEMLTSESLAVAGRFFAEVLTFEKREKRDLTRSGTLELEFKCKDGSTIWSEVKMSFIRDSSGRAIGILGVSRNITERKKAEKERAVLQEKLQQAQKMEAIGTLAGGIAHDFNNILAAIIGYAELAGFDIGENSKAKYNLQQSTKAALRAKDLVHQILTFSRQGGQERKVLDIQPIVKEGLKFLRSSLPATVEIRQEVGKDLGVIEGDPTQVYQVLMNLCTNAAQAMEEKGGVLEVSLGNQTVDGGALAAAAGIGGGFYVRLRVRDTGCGMPREVLERIFDPYFTTKEVGKGTGLGLAVVHGIVKSCGGGIEVSSEVGKGSVFDVYFPRIEAGSVQSVGEKVEPLPLGGNERVLFVDDEKAIAEIGRDVLERLGYRVVVRMSSLEALELFRAKPDQFDLVITDMTMPNMTGDRLAQEVMRIRPGMPVILCTGFSERMTEEKAKGMGIREFVMKPLVMKDLAKAMRRALGSRERKKG